MNRLKRTLAAGGSATGVLLRLPAVGLVELAGVAGLDFVLLDCEHGPADTEQVQHHLNAADAHGLATLVRVGSAEPALILRALDLGAQGVVVPHVDTAGQAAAVVAAAHYPPLGERGFANYTRAARFGSRAPADYLDDAAATTMVIPMLETAAACENAAEILAVPGVDAVMPGPADLAVSMGALADKPRVDAAIAAAGAAAERAGKPVLRIVGDAAAARATGSRFVVYNLTQVLLTAFRELVLTPR
ncbi:HpcH/HpaI aldolase/citrate lyase family protein [Amycolatopsis sp. 195334CR]|uniref:HpcH/HpaI aldolase family protein n=1 Tax=Amycolatopsis sp. 195334CR TaxID=2814588 RepID=UPI001A8FA1AC|nr:aldolase/citrate lyase family protein [Amycolatopsis sp. 195334CR]MBN6040484.1 2-dehydro-3-deoxyglucarate aldolase [Amycolatopsis sp. 195334CR]